MPRDSKEQRDWGKEGTYIQISLVHKDRGLVQNQRGPDTASPVQEPLGNGSPWQESHKEKPTTKGHRQQLGDTCFQTTVFKFHSEDVFFNKFLVYMV